MAGSFEDKREVRGETGSARSAHSLVPQGAIWGLCVIFGALVSPQAYAGQQRTGPDATDAARAAVLPSGPLEERVGPLSIRDDIRRRVRGDRSAGSSLHLAYASDVHQANPHLLRALKAFEDDALSGDRVLRKTVPDHPPEGWMERLRMPAMPVRWSPQLVEYLSYFRDDPKGRALLHAWLDRLGRYENTLRPILEETGVPGDIVYVALIESGLDPRAQSSVGAGGMWQFMEPTARVYGLDGDYWRDDRFDFERSAYAAGAYLADLKTRFGTWELALAAYNAGYGLVVKTIRVNNTNNFWALSEIENGLPRQTINYVPKILATAIAAHNPEVFGYTATPRPAAALVEVNVPGGTRIEDLATGLGIDESLLREYNGHWIRGRTSPELPDTKVRIPRSSLADFEGLDPKLRSPEQELISYSMRLGEHLDEVAARHGVTSNALRKLNGLHDTGELAPGVRLALPKVPDGFEAPAVPKPIVAVPALKSAGGADLVFFRVTRASTPRRISRSFGTSWDKIVAWNDLDPKARLVDGQMLQIFVPKEFKADPNELLVYRQDEVRHVVRGSQDHLNALLDDRELIRRGHKVKDGQTLARIAKMYDLSQGSLARINGVMRGHRPNTGDVLIVYVDKKHKRSTVAPPPPNKTTIGFEVQLLEGATDDFASSAQSAKLPGQERHFERDAATVEDDAVDAVGPASDAEANEGEGDQSGDETDPDADAGDDTARRSTPSTPASAKVPGARR